MLRKYLIALLACMPLTAAAQQLEEVIVTASRAGDGAQMPGKFLRKYADFLLLGVLVINDSREEDAREKEIYATLENLLADAGRDNRIEISLTTEDDLVIPLTRNNYRVELRPGGRPDTNATTIQVKTAVPDGHTDGQALINRLKDFVDDVKVSGRTELRPQGDVAISVVGPNQYRGEIVKAFAKDVKNVTDALGDGYRVVVEDIDRPVAWYRVSLLELALYIPYRYAVVPDTIDSYTVFPPLDY